MTYYPAQDNSPRRFGSRQFAEQVAATCKNGTVVPHPDRDGAYAIACTPGDRRKAQRQQKHDREY